MRKFCYALAISALLSLTANAAIKITAPANRGTVSQLRPMQRAFAMMTEEQLEAFITPEMVNRMGDATTYPAGVDVKWAAVKGAAGYTVRFGLDQELADARSQSEPQNEATLCNLEIGRTYYFQITANDADGKAIDQSAVQSFNTEALTPRMLKVPGVPNVRDLGGRVGLQGRMIPQGLIFRSSAFNDNSSDGGKTPGRTRMDEKNLAIERDAMGIKTEIDLRWDPELADMAASPLGPQVQYIRIPSTLYAGLFTQEGYENYRKLFPVFCKAENYPIDFHCILGADRTGSLALILLATLGVSREEIMRDYSFTTLYTPYLRAPHNMYPVFDGLEKCGKEGDTLSDQAMRYLLRCGVKSSQIQEFLRIVLGEGLEMPSVLLEAKAKEAIEERFNQPQEALAVKPHVVREETQLQNGQEFTWRLPRWYQSPLLAGYTDGHGAYMLQLRNSLSGPITLALQLNDAAAFGAARYHVFAPLAKQAYCAPNRSMRWSPAELADFRISLESEEELLLVVQPAATMPEGITAIPWQEPEFHPIFAEVRKTDQAPVIDGALDDEAWEAVAPYLLSDIHGEAVENAPQIWFATDAGHSVLYLAALLHDESPCGEAHAKRDAALWNEDSLEILLAAHGSTKTYHIIFNAENSVWDGIDNDNTSAWNAAQLESRAVRMADGWAIEAAIPLAQFDFEGALELNVCLNDNPGDNHLNLFVTHGNFHDRHALYPVLWK